MPCAFGDGQCVNKGTDPKMDMSIQMVVGEVKCPGPATRISTPPFHLP